jgi:DsbC/DsbD-like thiol-disulfide interchange protein
MRAHSGKLRNSCVIGSVVAAAIGLAAATTWGQAGTTPKKEEQQVKIEAHLSVDRLPAGGKCQILIRLTVQPGWHIHANPASSDELVATEVEFKGKQGTKLTNVKYPKGKSIKLENLDAPISAYEGKADIRGVLEIPSSAAGQAEEMEITVKYQACNDEKCLFPTKVKLTGKLPVAKAGEAVKSQNEKLFPTAAGGN